MRRICGVNPPETVFGSWFSPEARLILTLDLLKPRPSTAKASGIEGLNGPWPGFRASEVYYAWRPRGS